jgi:trans-2,3-dihydro-3-hydroxyanthranilate isomerase
MLCVAVRDRAALARARPTAAAYDPDLSNGIYLLTEDTGEAGVAWRARLFAPAHGIMEDPATGSAAAAFGGLLALLDARATAESAFIIRQGIEMGRPSTIELRTRKGSGQVTEVRIGGGAVLMAEGTIEV